MVQEVESTKPERSRGCTFKSPKQERSVEFPCWLVYYEFEIVRATDGQNRVSHRSVEDGQDAAWCAVHRRQRSGGAFQLLWHELHSGGVYDQAPDGRQRPAGPHVRDAGRRVVSYVRLRPVFPAGAGRASGGRGLWQVPYHPVSLHCVLRWPPRARFRPYAFGTGDWSRVNRAGGGRHQAVRQRQCWRPVRSIKPTSVTARLQLVLFLHQLRLGVFHYPYSRITGAIGAANRLRDTRRVHVHCDCPLLAGTQDIRPHSTRRGAQLRKGTLSARKPEGARQSVDSRSVRRHVLGAVAAEFFVVGCAGGQNGPAHLRQRMATGANPDRQSHFHPRDAAALCLRYLSCDRQSVSLDAAAKNSPWPLRHGVCFCDRDRKSVV